MHVDLTEELDELLGVVPLFLILSFPRLLLQPIFKELFEDMIWRRDGIGRVDGSLATLAFGVLPLLILSLEI